MKTTIAFYAVVLSVLFLPYIINFTDLTQCDFEADYKCEVTHGIGVVVPPLSYITVWFDVDEE